MDFSQPHTIYEKASDGESYHGGYTLEQQYEPDNQLKYLGGESKTITRYDTMVIPFGIFYKNRMNDLHQNTANRLLENHQESECIDPDVFDRLFYAVGRVEIPRQIKYSDNSKTKKMRK